MVIFCRHHFPLLQNRVDPNRGHYSFISLLGNFERLLILLGVLRQHNLLPHLLFLLPVYGPGNNFRYVIADLLQHEA